MLCLRVDSTEVLPIPCKQRPPQFPGMERKEVHIHVFLSHFENLISTRCMCEWRLRVQRGWRQRAHLSLLLPYLQSTASFLYVLNMFEKAGKMEVFAALKGCTWHWKYLFQEIPHCVYKMSISQGELPINIWKMSPSTYSWVKMWTLADLLV